VIGVRLGWSLAGRAAAVGIIGAFLGLGTMLLLDAWGLPAATAAVLSLLVSMLGVTVTAAVLLRSIARVIEALDNAVESLASGDSSVRLAVTRRDEIGRLVSLVNRLGEVIATERRHLRQRELMLAAVLEANPTAVMLVNPVHRVLVANRAARELVSGGGRIEGETIDHVAAAAPPCLRGELIRSESGEAVVSNLPEEGGATFQITRQSFDLNARRHRLLLVRNISPDLRRQEVAIWKRVIRVVGHEINNSLAPIRSLLASSRKLVVAGDPDQRLPRILDTIDDSAARLHRFVDGYRRVTRLPAPTRERVHLHGFLADLRQLAAFDLAPTDPGLAGVFDPAQLQQVVLNLVRNAREAGADTVTVSAVAEAEHLEIRVRDDGPGLSADDQAQALMPFWTTKAEGSGLGLPLCREILEQHGGSLSLESPGKRGLLVTCRLPNDSERSDRPTP
jgi:two-component system nitrogen regulation sensor histidine kinase NtrY